MKLLTKAYVLAHKNEIIQEMLDGKIFVYPTDTIYGLGCNALNSEAISKIRVLKKRTDKPFSVIVPSMEWLVKNCEIPKLAKNWVSKLPGPYTLILPLKNNYSIAPEVNLGLDSLGIRIPNHWFVDFIKECNVPFITTSVNASGNEHMADFYNLEDSIKQGIDYVIYEGSKLAKPSMIISLTDDKEVIINR